jgi:queuine/archaeosine tRNA-ribosyltransferase
MADMRAAIERGTFAAFRDSFYAARQQPGAALPSM